MGDNGRSPSVVLTQRRENAAPESHFFKLGPNAHLLFGFPARDCPCYPLDHHVFLVRLYACICEVCTHVCTFIVCDGRWAGLPTVKPRAQRKFILPRNMIHTPPVAGGGGDCDADPTLNQHRLNTACVRCDKPISARYTASFSKFCLELL